MSVNTNQLHCSCFRHIINILLTELSRSVWENLDLGRVYRPHRVQSVITTSVKILLYRPPARLIRANYRLESSSNCYEQREKEIISTAKRVTAADLGEGPWCQRPLFWVKKITEQGNPAFFPPPPPPPAPTIPLAQGLDPPLGNNIDYITNNRIDGNYK